MFARNGQLVVTEAELVAVTCHGCGILYAIPTWLEDLARKKGKHVRCPNLNCPWPSWGYVESEVEKLTKQLEAQRLGRELAQRRFESERNSHRATRGQFTRTKRRIAAGVCPCCRRTFQNLAAHMQGQHPKYAKAGVKPRRKANE